MVVTQSTTLAETSSQGTRSKGKNRKGVGDNNKNVSKNVENRDDDAMQTSSAIKDEQVTVNLAMADLMAYLQVVANNSNNLPLTRRDDPELRRMVTNLTKEEYAKKSAAFIPADVRVIAGSFLKYGNVWDLPTSEEYVASDGAQEPGRSYGGACTNSMLKALYDAASEATNAVHSGENGRNSLFDDDDDESLATLPFTRNSTFASLDMNGQSNPTTITWADLLRKMKFEMNEIGYVQAPTIGSTRKFDLNIPFSLVPQSFDKVTGRKRSLLIGCNYHGNEEAELKASHDDVRSMKDYIVNVHGFSESEEMMTILLDDNKHEPPTFINIVEAFKSLSEQSQPGDAVFIQFSGHGGRILDSESYDEMLVPSDYSTSGIIRDTLIFKTLLAPMRYGVTVTIVIDSCDTGMMLDLPYLWSTRSSRSDSTAKMKQSEDFSFVRFLKVVKTLYESSTFTQLGKTVGSALGEQSAIEESSDGEDDNKADAAVVEMTYSQDAMIKSNTEEMQGTGSFFQSICSPRTSATTKQSNTEEKEGSGSFFQSLCSPRTSATIKQSNTEEMQGSESFFQSLCSPRISETNTNDKIVDNNDEDALTTIVKMLGCNFIVQDLESEYLLDEEGTYANETFDSMSDDEYRRASRRRSRRKRR